MAGPRAYEGTEMAPAADAVSLDELIALNDEIAALTRAGVPLESGLTAVGQDVPGTLGRALERIGDRMRRGESLSTALDGEGEGLPPVYRAITQAGLRSGRLPLALESLATSARSLAETRRSISSALVYPLLVALIAYGLFVGFVFLFAPRMLETFEVFRLPAPWLVSWMVGLQETAFLWAPLAPCLLLGLLWLWSRWSGKGLMQSSWMGLPLKFAPWVGPILLDSRRATFAEVLAVLIESELPLPEALVLAGNSSGDLELSTSAQRLSESLARGASVAENEKTIESFPPLIAWALTVGIQQGNLAAMCRHAAETYRQRAIDRAETLRVLLPAVAVLVIGGLATFFYALLLFVPWAQLLRELVKV